MQSKGTILVTGGVGYIGSHVSTLLTNIGYETVIIDNLSNSNEQVLQRLGQLNGGIKPTFYNGNINDPVFVNTVFSKHLFSAVIHFAALKAVQESVQNPLLYYETNVGGLVNLLKVMEQYKVFSLIFSSSATVYGNPNELPITENHSTGACTNPYGKTKYFCEEILKDVYFSGSDKWNICLLRYFNPVGAHPSGLIGEDPLGVPKNLLPAALKAMFGLIPELKVYGIDWDTPDGTGVRDYIHIMDLAEGHAAALQYMEKTCGLGIFNLGTGVGYSVLEVIKMLEKVSDKKVPYQVVDRRDGDIASCYANCKKAEVIMKWKASRGLEEMCRDAFEFTKSANEKNSNI